MVSTFYRRCWENRSMAAISSSRPVTQSQFARANGSWSKRRETGQIGIRQMSPARTSCTIWKAIWQSPRMLLGNIPIKATSFRSCCTTFGPPDECHRTIRFEAFRRQLRQARFLVARSELKLQIHRRKGKDEHETANFIRKNLGQSRRIRGAGPADDPVYRPAPGARGYKSAGIRRLTIDGP